MYHLLLVDDEDITLDRLRSTIRWDTLGIGVVSVAYSMMQAQRVYQAKPVDLMICDIEMPGGSGLELLDQTDPAHATDEAELPGGRLEGGGDADGGNEGSTSEAEVEGAADSASVEVGGAVVVAGALLAVTAG